MSSIAANVTVGLGLISTTVSVHSGKDAEQKTQTVNCCVGQADKSHAPTPVTRPLTCEHCGELAHEGKLVKGKRVGQGVVLLTYAEVAELKAEELQFKGVVGLAPFPAAQVAMHTVQGDKLYQLHPKVNDGRYATLAAIIADSPEVAFLARYTVRTRASLFWVRVNDGVILLEERTHEAALRPLPKLDSDVDAKMFMAGKAMLPVFIEDFNPELFRNTYKDKLDKMTAKKDVVSTEALDTVLYSGKDNDEIADLIQEAIALGLAKKNAAKAKMMNG